MAIDTAQLDELRKLVPERSAADIFSYRVRVLLGQEIYTLATLPIAANEEWLGRVDAEFAVLLDALAGKSTEGVDEGHLLNLLAGRRATQQLELVMSWDQGGLWPPAAKGNVLPPRDELERNVYPLELLVGVLTLWRVANPLADIAQTPTEAPATNGTSPGPTKARRPSTAGRRRKSARR